MKSLGIMRLLFSAMVLIIFIGCGGGSSSSTSLPTGSTTNDVIGVNAGEDKTIKVGETIILEAKTTMSGSYMWVKGESMVDGQTIISFNSKYTFTAKEAGVFPFSVQVKNSDGFARDTVVITVVKEESNENQPPVANAGEDKSVIVNETITLTGKGTDSDGTISSYKWTKEDETLATTAQFDYIPTTVGTDILMLTVTDDEGATATDKVEITVNGINENNQAPIANAGEDKSVTVNQSIKITGTGTDSDGNISAYEWKKEDVILATTASFTYQPTVVGQDILTLIVTDNNGLKSSSDSMVVTVKNKITPIVDGRIDLAQYQPSQSMTKNYIEKYKFTDEEKEEVSTSKDEVTVSNNTISMVSTYSDNTDIDTDVWTINSNTINYEWNNGKNSTVGNRYVNIGDITMEDSTSYSTCVLVEKLTTFSHDGYQYSGDIIKEKCNFYGISYNYSKKGLGIIAHIQEADTTFDYYNWYYVEE